MATVLKKSFGWGMLNFVTMKHFFIELSTFTMYIVQAEKLTMESGWFDMMKNDRMVEKATFVTKISICYKNSIILTIWQNFSQLKIFCIILDCSAHY